MTATESSTIPRPNGSEVPHVDVLVVGSPTT
ncbi:hypothetical protein GGQ55_004488 [Geodermatophilus daqingensis]|uniref:Uncharacterized protein n=1 Tax=Petropleomorpha daqingensis TaxID=2026353 RepID=A0A853CKB9_9ACTN|nr:hypothetical protein [Petropleomorpha daqingensis]